MFLNDKQESIGRWKFLITTGAEIARTVLLGTQGMVNRVQAERPVSCIRTGFRPRAKACSYSSPNESQPTDCLGTVSATVEFRT